MVKVLSAAKTPQSTFLKFSRDQGPASQRMMDFALRCNNLKCRAQLTDRAVVTTCRYELKIDVLTCYLTAKQSHLLYQLLAKFGS